MRRPTQIYFHSFSWGFEGENQDDDYTFASELLQFAQLTQVSKVNINFLILYVKSETFKIWIVLVVR